MSNDWTNPSFLQTDAALREMIRLVAGLRMELQVQACKVFSQVNLTEVDSNANDGSK